MAELSELARRLIDTAVARDEPPPVEQGWDTIVTRLSAEAAPAQRIDEVAIAAPRRAPRPRAWWLVGVLAAVAAGGGWWWSSTARPTAPTSAATAASSPAVPRAAVVPAPTPAEPPAIPPAQLLREAEAALREGAAARALVLLQQHAEQAPLDPEAPQRMALRVLALCRTAQTQQARDEARALLAAHPQPRWRATLRGACVDALLQ